MDEKLKQKRLFEIDQQIIKGKNIKNGAILGMVISLFLFLFSLFIWSVSYDVAYPLIIIGGIILVAGILVYYVEITKINKLLDEKRIVIFKKE